MVSSRAARNEYEARRYSGPRPDGGVRSTPEDKTVIETQLDPC
jgi:hypothetical protein